MRADVWRRRLYAPDGYGLACPKQAEDILRAIERGAPVDFEGIRSSPRRLPNHPIKPEHLQKVRDVIAADVAALKKAGPLAPYPLPIVHGHPLWVSPIGAVPKKYSDKVRVIHDLSAPKGGDSVNAGILDGSLSISSFGHAAQAVRRLGRGAWLIKLDVEAAYKQVPVRPEDWHLLGFEFEGKLYYERVLPFGLRSSCRLWELFAAALHFMCARLGCGAAHEVIHYVDDFLFVVSPAGGQPAAAALLRGALSLCEELGVPMAPNKVEGPSQCLEFLGIMLDTVKMEARLPEVRLQRLHALMVEWQSSPSASIHQLQSLAGLLNFASGCVSPGRVYTRRIINFTTRLLALGCGKHARCALTPAVRADIAWWAEFLHGWNGVSLLYEAEWTEAPTIELWTDACLHGFGAYFAGRWLAGAWSPEEMAAAQRTTRVSMPFLEMRALHLAASAWGELWRGKKILFHCDCKPVVDAFGQMRSSNAQQMHQIRALHQLAARHGFDFRVQHIAGVTNTVADVLSRDGDCPQFRALCPDARARADPTPLLPIPPPDEH